MLGGTDQVTSGAPIGTSVNKSRPPAPFTQANQATKEPSKNLFGFTRTGFCRGIDKSIMTSFCS